MPMERENHENLLQELLTPDLETSRRTEILQELRADYGTVVDEHNELTGNNERLRRDNDDLIVSNSKLFRQAGMMDNPEQQKEEKEKEFSETVTIEDMESQAN